MAGESQAALSAPRSGPVNSGRPATSVVIPFAGETRDAQALASALARLRLQPGDEVVLVDNSVGQVARDQVRDTGARVISAEIMRSSYYARNAGAEAAVNDWLLFLDSDCVPAATLLDDYFGSPIDTDVGAVAGEIVGDSKHDGLMSRYAHSRGHLSQAKIVSHPRAPFAVTANLLVRRAAWQSLGGFHEGIRSAGDADFCWRLRDRGWRLGYAPQALVEHRHRETFGAMVRQFARYGAGGAWAQRRHPGYQPPSLLTAILRALAGAVVWTLTGRLERALFKVLDGALALAYWVGWTMSNVSPPARSVDPAEARGALKAVAFLDSFPQFTETFLVNELRELRRLGHVRVEAIARPALARWPSARDIPFSFIEDDGLARKAIDLAWLWRRNPAACARDLVDRRRWRREEQPSPLRALAPVARRVDRRGERHIHAYFAAGASLNALRVGRLMRLPYSLTAYAYDVFRSPANLREKLTGAAFIVSVSDATVEHLRGILGDGGRPPVVTVGMGVDVQRFRRRRPHPDAGALLAVGRLVEKKGFGHLIEATARLQDRAPVRSVTIMGDGPLRNDLMQLAHSLGVETTVRFTGSRTHDQVRELMEAADIFVMPCVVAADGDRDSLPAVVSEALAMELPVVATDVAGLPELVHPEWGRIVSAGDAEALAEAIAALLELDLEARLAMGQRGRSWIAEQRDPPTEARKLAALIEGAGHH